MLAVVVAGGCFSPTPPPGAYQCSTADKSCPVGQHCTCNLCVYNDTQAACSLGVATTSKSVAEHQQFTVTVTAYQSNGMVANGFNGPVTLQSTWGDVQPSPTVMLQNGVGKAQIRLNRETVPPQTAKLNATFAGNSGAAISMAVTAPPFVKDLQPVAAPPSSQQPFGFADALVAQPDVIKVASGWRMYFGGVASGRGYLFGVATSSDGSTFTPSSTAVLTAGGANFDMQSIDSPSVFTCGGATSMVFAATGNASNTIGLATSPDGLMPFTLANNNMPVLRRIDCLDYCNLTLAFPSVIAAPTSGVDGGACGNWLMFFSSATTSNVYSIGSASSTDGVHFTPAPAPLLSGDLGNEALLFSPRVIIDGSVYKMFYTFVRARDLNNNPCDSLASIGYATSTDGLYWVRSPSNVHNPALAAGGNGWDSTILGFLAGSVVASDGSDVKNGLTLYYSTFRLVTLPGMMPQCLPNGIGRAVRATPPPLM